MNFSLLKKTRLSTKFAFWLCMFFFSTSGFAIGQTNQDIIPSKPEPAVFVNDFAGIMNPAEKANLEKKLEAVSQATTNQIVVVTIPTLNNYDVSDFSVQLALKWGIGQKGKDNGVLLLIAVQERKIRIETGYGIEADLPDIICKQIIDQLIKPNFKKNEYSTGIALGTDAILQRIVPKEQWVSLGIGSQESIIVDDSKFGNKKSSKSHFGFWIILAIIIILSCFRGGRSLLFAMLLSGGGGGGSGRSSGGSSFGGGSFGGGGASGDW